MSSDTIVEAKVLSSTTCKTEDSNTENLAHREFSDSDVSNTNRSSSTGTMCDVCSQVPPKYTCPGCAVRTCSLVCVKDHKVKLNCNGERNKFATMDMTQYSDRHLLNDYRFLENAERSVYSNKMVPKNRHMGSMHHHTPYQTQSKRSRILMTAAGKREIRLRIMPNNLARHKENTSFYTINSDLIEWHIEWQFVSSNCLVKDSKVPETTVLLEASKKFGNAVDYPHLRKALEDYRKCFDKCRYLIKVDGLPANRKRFVEMNARSTIGENLKGLSLVEYPTIFVLPPSYHSSANFPLLDKDTDLPHMHTAHMKHLSTHHPDYSETKILEHQLLNKDSSVYKPEPEPVTVIDVDDDSVEIIASVCKPKPVVVIDVDDDDDDDDDCLDNKISSVYNKPKSTAVVDDDEDDDDDDDDKICDDKISSVCKPNPVDAVNYDKISSVCKPNPVDAVLDDVNDDGEGGHEESGIGGGLIEY